MKVKLRHQGHSAPQPAFPSRWPQALLLLAAPLQSLQGQISRKGVCSHHRPRSPLFLNTLTLPSSVLVLKVMAFPRLLDKEVSEQ